MASTLLSFRLSLQQPAGSPGPDPILRFGRKCVAALWNCGCAAVGSDTEHMTLIGCWEHQHLELSEPLGARPYVFPSRAASRAPIAEEPAAMRKCLPRDPVL